MTSGPVEALLGFSRRAGEAGSPGDVAVPGYPDNRIVQVPCTIHDARLHDASLDREGFTLVRHASAYADERDKGTLARDYHEEIAKFLKEYLGASTVLASGGSALLVARLHTLEKFEIHALEPIRVTCRRAAACRDFGCDVQPQRQIRLEPVLHPRFEL